MICMAYLSEQEKRELNRRIDINWRLAEGQLVELERVVREIGKSVRSRLHPKTALAHYPRLREATDNLERMLIEIEDLIHQLRGY